MELIPNAKSTSTPEQDLKDKCAIVTGASRGIGRAIAIQLLRRGCTIIGTCSSSESLPLFRDIVSNASETDQELLMQSTPSSICISHTTPCRVRLSGVVADILSPHCADTIAEHVASLGMKVDILVLNAAITGSIRIGQTVSANPAEEIQRFLVGNIQTPALIVDQLALRRMFQAESRIVLISSIRSKLSIPTSSMYSATKAAGESLVRTWAEAFGGKQAEYSFMAGTTANAVQVGLTQTTALSRASPEDLNKYKEAYIPQQSLPRLAEPDDVADVVGLLCSRQARWITGSVIPANGGGCKIG